jgi:hypothetical protein
MYVAILQKNEVCATGTLTQCLSLADFLLQQVLKVKNHGPYAVEVSSNLPTDFHSRSKPTPKRILQACWAAAIQLTLRSSFFTTDHIVISLHGWCGLEAAGSWIEAGFQMVVVSWLLYFRSKSVEESPSVLLQDSLMPRTSEALAAQYLNVRQRTS